MVNALAALFGDSDNYVEKYQKAVVAAVSKFTAKTDPALSESGFIDLIKEIMKTRGLAEALKSPVKTIISEMGSDSIAQLQYAHYPELCLAWMDAITDADMNKSATTRYLRVNCPVDVSVYDSEGILVAQIVNDVAQEIEGGIASLVDENGQKIIVMPFDEEFRIVTTATGNGEMSYQVEEYDIAAAESIRLINYYDVAISAGDELIGTAGSSTEARAEYTLEDVDGTVLSPTVEQEGENIEEFLVMVDCDGNGAVQGGGTFLAGEFAKLTATPQYDEQFLGWYSGDELLSAEAEYRFRVEQDMQIIGKFTRNHITVIRLSGKTRYQTAFAVADQLKQNLELSQFSAVVVTYGQNFPDALTGSYLAAVMGAPILLTESSANAMVLEYMAANLIPGGKVYILGGTAAVTQAFEDGAKALGFDVQRLKGKNRYDTNLAILKEAGISSADEILIATGENYADSLSASATGLPMLLVGQSLTEDQKAFLATTSGHFVILGGTGAVSQEIEDQLNEIGTAIRVKGKDRYGTSISIAERYFEHPRAAVLAYAQDFPDGLCGGPLALSMGAPLILTSNEKPDAADSYIDGITVGAVTGGTGRISDDTVRAIFDLAVDAEIPKP